MFSSLFKLIFVGRFRMTKNKRISQKKLHKYCIKLHVVKILISDGENFSGLICLEIIDLFFVFLYTVLLLSHFLLNGNQTLKKMRRGLLCPEDLHSHPKTFQCQFREIINFFAEASRIKGSEGSNEIKNFF